MAAYKVFSSPLTTNSACNSPYKHCSAAPSQCTVLWQIFFVHLKLRSDRTGNGGASASLRPDDEAAGSHGVGTNNEEEAEPDSAPTKRGKAPVWCH